MYDWQKSILLHAKNSVWTDLRNTGTLKRSQLDMAVHPYNLSPGRIRQEDRSFEASLSCSRRMILKTTARKEGEAIASLLVEADGHSGHGQTRHKHNGFQIGRISQPLDFTPTPQVLLAFNFQPRFQSQSLGMAQNVLVSQQRGKQACSNSRIQLTGTAQPLSFGASTTSF